MALYFFLLIAAALAFGLTPLVRYVAQWVGAVDHPGERKIHAVPIPRLGGVSVVVSGLLTVLSVWEFERVTAGVMQIDPGVWKPVALGGALVFLLGVWDDIRPVPAWVKFVVQGGAAGVATPARTWDRSCPPTHDPGRISGVASLSHKKPSSNRL